MFAFEDLFGGYDEEWYFFEDGSCGNELPCEDAASFAFHAFDFDQCGGGEFHVVAVSGVRGAGKPGNWGTAGHARESAEKIKIMAGNSLPRRALIFAKLVSRSAVGFLPAVGFRLHCRSFAPQSREEMQFW